VPGNGILAGLDFKIFPRPLSGAHVRGFAPPSTTQMILGRTLLTGLAGVYKCLRNAFGVHYSSEHFSKDLPHFKFKNCGEHW
jgi:hypothetical protein